MATSTCPVLRNICGRCVQNCSVATALWVVRHTAHSAVATPHGQKRNLRVPRISLLVRGETSKTDLRRPLFAVPGRLRFRKKADLDSRGRAITRVGLLQWFPRDT